MPTTPPRNGRFSRSAFEVIFVGSVGKSTATSAAGTLARTSSGGATTVHAGSQYPQNPVPGACSISVPNRIEWPRRCQLSESVKVVLAQVASLRRVGSVAHRHVAFP